MSTEVVIPWELKYKFVQGMLTTLFKGFMYEIRQEYGATAALKIYERVCRRDDRVKNMTKTLKEVFKIEGNDAEALTKWFNIYFEVTGIEGTTVELTKTYSKTKIIKCPFKTGYKDISMWYLTCLGNIITETLNPKATLERPKAMCAGDPFCEYIMKIKE